MRRSAKLWCLSLLFLGVLAAPLSAHAQFANRSVNLSVGYLDLNYAAVSDGFPIGIGYSGYIEAGFEWTVAAQFMILRNAVANRQMVGAAGGPGIRYLFLEESLRPYVGGELTYLHVFDPEVNFQRVGIGPYVGVDYFLTDSFSLGARGQVNLYLMLNEPVNRSVGLNVIASAWF